MLWTALQDPDPVLIFEHEVLYNTEGELAEDACTCRHQNTGSTHGTRVTLITYGGSREKHLQAAKDDLARKGVVAEVVDLRTLRPLDTEKDPQLSRTRTHRAPDH